MAADSQTPLAVRIERTTVGNLDYFEEPARDMIMREMPKSYRFVILTMFDIEYLSGVGLISEDSREVK